MIEPKVIPELARYREDYPILEDSVYMNSNSMGAMPRSVQGALEEYARVWEREGVEAWHTWTDVVDQTADMAARFFGGEPGETTLGQNVATFQATIASCIDWSGPRNKVVVEELQFPNVLYVWERFQDLGAKLVLVPSDDGITVPTERMLEAIDEHTAIVPLSHGIYVSGAMQDVGAVCKRAHEVGALVMADVYQTVGSVPIDVRAWDLDILVGGSHKWLCGGPGTCFLWVRPELRQSLEPKNTGWMAHATPFSFSPPPIRYAKTPWCFMSGTPPVPAHYVARAAYRNLLEVGIDRIRAHNMALCQIVIDRAQQAGLAIHSPLDHAVRTGFVAVDFAGSEQASKKLIEERYKHDYRPDCGLRIGPHFYSTEDEVHRMMDRVTKLAGRL